MTPVNRFLRICFLFLALLLVAFGAVFACSLHALGEPVLKAKSIWGALFGAIFFTMTALRFSVQAKAKIFMVIFSLVIIEAFLQVLAWTGVLPGVNTKIKAPFARVYWSSEGRGNSIRNRFGWHYPEFDLKAPKRIAVIGDSFVEAVEVGRNQNEAAILHQFLRAQSPQWSVLAFGAHGTSPAQHLDSLDYAQRHFAPQEVIVFLYLGNDINESSPALNYAAPENFLYYDLDPADRLVLLSASANVRERIIQSLELCHRPLWIHLPALAKSHCMILQSVISLSEIPKRARSLSAMAKADPEAAKWGRIGLSLKPFAKTQDAEAKHAMEILLAELSLLRQKCKEHQITLHLATIPFFPPQFYETQHGTNWTTQLGDYDFFGPDRQIATFAKGQNISFLSFGEWLTAKKLNVDEIRSLYFSNGSGHFTPRGHRLCAQAVYDSFYASSHQ